MATFNQPRFLPLSAMLIRPCVGCNARQNGGKTPHLGRLNEKTTGESSSLSPMQQAGAASGVGTAREATAPAAQPPCHTPAALQRIRSDLRSIFRDPPPGIFVWVNDADLTTVHALVTGPEGTPYEGGFFWFKLEPPFDYPNCPPKVTLMTTDGGRVRFNPNLYASGKVCLSILNTWAHGPQWSPAQSLSSTLISIQSLMNSRPLTNEPGYETPRNPRDVDLYNDIVAHETIRVAVCETLEGTGYSRSMPPAMVELAREVAPNFFSFYEGVVSSHIAADHSPMVDPFGEERGVFVWRSLHERLAKLRAALDRPEDGEEDDVEDDAGGGEG